MTTKNIIAAALLSILSINVNAQKARINAADKKYERYAYIDAIQIYERVAEKGHKSVDLFQKLGNAYYFNGELTKANKWYNELFDLEETIEPEYYYRYAQTLKASGEYDKANQMLEKFSQINAEDLRAKQFQSNKDYLEDIKNNSNRYTVENAGINSNFSDYGTAFLGNQLIFASNRELPGFSKKIQEWNNQQFTAIYSSKVNGDGNLENPERLMQSIDTKFNEATPVFTRDGKTMYFTRNNYNNGKRGKDSDRTTGLKIYKSTFNGKWENVTELPFNSDEYNVAHPALSPDEKTLYFASNMPGTKGESDLYKVKINADGSFGTPENLGVEINTEGRETFPFVTEENELYFASDGHPGLGGLDIYKARFNDGKFTSPVNIGTPINGPMDDFAFFIDLGTKVGFFSSNREGGMGFDDIYKFTEIEELKCEQLIAGIITDSQTNEILANAKVTLFDSSMRKINEVISDAEGKYSFEAECNKKYYVRAEKEGYHANEKSIEVPNESGETQLDIALDPKEVEIPVGGDLAEIFKIKEILFDLDKHNIRPDAALELEKIIQVMKDYPNMVIAIRSHTDCRASHAYNEKLSDRRAKSTMNYMISQGIDKARLTAQGFGETQLRNECADGVPCTEEQHQYNRRSEFKILKVK
ncbi:OmpA family protein [Flavobacterium sp. NST-5]|uniref:OmpA family protein n=1 Tax=Flavobacterium ichthyis TaxID=2698827 RepID=A0ABW9Z4Y7_9FLAO|nr:OmpA family protein [Flavobacterium ichthyis]NBL63902.1 OmpA family protein [Flavobacterium ichthyis]